jgi:hypothetical protein
MFVKCLPLIAAFEISLSQLHFFLNHETQGFALLLGYNLWRFHHGGHVNFLAGKNIKHHSVYLQDLMSQIM